MAAPSRLDISNVVGRFRSRSSTNYVALSYHSKLAWWNKDVLGTLGCLKPIDVASKLLGRCGHDVRVGDVRQLALITNSNAKCDKRDARTLVLLVRADPRPLSPIEHRAENLQMDLTVIRMRDNLIETAHG